MAERVWNVDIYPRGAVTTGEWLPMVKAREEFINRATITEKFDDTKLHYGPSFHGGVALNFLNPDGKFSGVHDSRSIFRASGRNKCVVHIEDFFTGVGTEVGSLEDSRNATAKIKTNSAGGLLKDFDVPTAALVPNLHISEFIRRCLTSVQGYLPRVLSPFYDIRDEVSGNALYDSLLVEDPSAFLNTDIFSAIGNLCGVTDTALRVGRRFCGVYNRQPYDKFGVATVGHADLFGRTMKIDDGHSRVYTSARVEHGGVGDDVNVTALGGSSAQENSARRLNVNLKFVTNRNRAAEIAEQVLQRLSFPVTEVEFEIANIGDVAVELLSRIDLRVFWPDTDRRNIYGDFYVVETKRDLSKDTISVRAQRSKI